MSDRILLRVQFIAKCAPSPPARGCSAGRTELIGDIRRNQYRLQKHNNQAAKPLYKITEHNADHYPKPEKISSSFHMVWQKGLAHSTNGTLLIHRVWPSFGLDTVHRTSHGLLYWLRFNARHLTIAGGHVISDISTLIRGSTVGEGYADCLDIRLVAIKGLGLRSGVFYFIFWEVKMSQYEQPEQNVRSLMLTMAPEGGDQAGPPAFWLSQTFLILGTRAGLGLEGIYMAAFRVEVIVEVAYSSPNDVRRHIGGYSLCPLARGYRGGRLCHIYEAAHKWLSDLDAAWVKLNLSTLGTSPPASWCWPMYLGLPVAPPSC
ncbi:hypothetical protein BS47DRAFT_1369238 [Hydnum rufescens UP504]|uniref:Uncharacterized protein n=1 Tax=Hydnum rufescens UP504 TaxID=1448309 RepID=A0A9P6DHC5_9AGAM|nr:hypothetical protein BS47DRAFT_1369238 [Hydnum rufescens UP504]